MNYRIKDEGKYIGKHVALRSFEERTVIVYGNDNDSVLKKAKELCENPIILYIPDRRGSNR